MTSPLARSAILAFAALALACACATPPAAQPLADPTGSPRPTPAASGPTGPSGRPSPSAAAGCTSQAIDDVRTALAAVEAYRYAASGFVHEEVYPADPLQAPTTRQVPVAFEGAYESPDRSSLSYTGRAPEGEPAETRTIGRDLWVLTDDGWQSLPGAVTAEGANVIAALVDDAGDEWTASQEPALAGEGCLLVARQPTPGGTGTRELALRVDPATGLPTVLRAEVRNAVDRLGNRQDSRLEYQVTVDPSISVDRPD